MASQAPRTAEILQKICTLCGLTKSTTEFYVKKRKSGHLSVVSSCKCCHRKMTAKWRKENREKHAAQIKSWAARNKKHLKGSRLRRYYGMTTEAFDDLLKKQDGKCAVCRTSDPGRRGTFFVDHCHKTKKLRGLLCSWCNWAIGLFRDDPVAMKRAAEYVEVHNGISVS